MSIKKLTKRIWYGSDTTVDSEGKTVAAAPPVATNDGSKDWDLKGLVRGELYLNDNKDDPALFFLGSDNVPRRIEGKGSSFTGYWTLVTTNAAGEALEEGKEYIRTDYTAISKGDVIAYGIGDPDENSLPIASYSQVGLIGVTPGGGLIIDSDGYMKVDPSILGNTGGIDEEQLKQYLTNNNYITSDYLTEQGYIKLSSPLTGYAILGAYTPITETDTIISAIGKLERNFDNYVDLTTDQTVNGTKTFSENVLSKKDIIAFASGQEGNLGIPVATASQLGLVGVKSGGGVIVDADGYISIDPSYAGGGSGISQITSSGTGNAVTSLTYDESTKTLTYVKGNTFALASQIPTSLKNPYALSWNGYSTGTYDGSAAKTLSIPNNTNQLTNGAGFIKDGNGNFTTLTGSGSNTKYLAGNGTFYTIAYSELSGTPDLSIYMPKAGGTFTGNVNMNTGSTFPYYRVTNSVGWAQLAGTSGTYLGSALSGIIQSSLAFAIMGRNSSPNMVVFDGGTVKASKDVIAFATSDADDLIAIATTDMYGLVKIDGTTIKVNSSGQIYAAGGGSTVSASASYTSGTSIGAITIDGTKTTFYVPNKVGTSTVGGTAKPIYLSSGTPTACSSTVGGTSKPVYMSSGTVTACSATVGSASLPVYMSSGSLTACTASSLFSALSYSGSTLSITVAGKTRTATISGGSGSWNGGTVTNTIIAPYLWINTTSSSHRLAVNGGALVTGNMQVDSNLFVGTTQSSYKCAIVGNGIITGTWQQNSDMRLKDRIDGVSGVLMAINTLDVFRYTWKDGRDKKYHLGVSAQQIQAIFPELVGSDIYDGYLNVDYTTLGVIVAVQGIKELYRKHTALDNIVRSRQHWELTKDQQIKHLQDTVIRLQKEIEDLKGGVAA